MPTAANANLEFEEDTVYVSFDEPDPKRVFQAANRAIKSSVCTTSSPKVFACTSNKSSYSWHSENINDQKCQISSFHLIEKIIYKIPEWENSDEMPRTVQTKWNRYINETISHEEVHGDIIKKHATDAYNEVLRLKGKCKEMKSLVEKVMKKSSRKRIADHRRFDARSGNMGKASILP